MSRKTFHNLLERYLKGKCSPEEQEIVRKWYDLLDSEQDLALNDADFEELEVRLWDKIHEKTYDEEDKKKGLINKSLIFRKRFLTVAASIMLLLIASWWLGGRIKEEGDLPKFSKTINSDVIIVTNQEDTPKLIRLPDGSTIALYKGSEIKYTTRFNANREILLKGDALFDVKASVDYPFIVYQDGMITRVLGTKFLIKESAVTGRNEVIVYSGRVEVIETRKNKSLLEKIIEKPNRVHLAVNQRVIVDAKQHSLNETLVENPIPLETKRTLLNNVSFNEIALSKLTEKLSEIYGVSIEVDPKIKHTTFTGDLSNLELFSQLGIICNVTETNYKIQGKTIVIQ